jgi:folate-binding protein YgfZ
MHISENRFAVSPPSAALRATGDDAAAFLQGQFTNELRKPVGSVTYGLLLDQKGKVLADSHVLRFGDNDFMMVSTRSPAAEISRRLEAYLVADDVSLVDETLGQDGLILLGPNSGEVLARLLGSRPDAGQFMRSAGVVVFRDRQLPMEHYRVLGPGAEVAKLRAALADASVPIASAAELEYARLSAGIPAVPTDVGPTDLPNEAGLDETAISYTKGCYLGQEVMARLKNLGQVRRRLQVVRGTGTPPAIRSALFQGEKKIGELRSVASHGVEYVGLAMISLINFQAGAGVSVAPDAAPTLTVQTHG